MAERKLISTTIAALAVLVLLVLAYYAVVWPWVNNFG